MAEILPAGFEDECSDDSDDFDYNCYRQNETLQKTSRADPWEANGNEWRTGDNWENGESWNITPNNCAEQRLPEVDLSKKLGKAVGLPIDDLRIAILNADLETVQHYIENGVGADICLKGEWTPLLYAASAACPDIVQYLLEHKADSNYDKAEMFTPLMAVCTSSEYDEKPLVQCVTLLIEYKAEVDFIDRYHTTPLMYAAKKGRLLVIQKLLEHKASVNMKDSQGWTALFHAANCGYMTLVCELKKAGANTEIKNNRQDTAADVAYSRSFEQIAAYLDDIYKESTEACTSQSTEPSVDPSTNHFQLPDRYGELELFLHGLELSSFIGNFHKHQITFSQLLRLTDTDLEKIGINQIGARKKLIDAIKAVHQKDWQASSLMKIQYDNSITFADATAMLANISKHTLYITSTIGYISDQIKVHPEIVTDTHDTKLLKQFVHYSLEARTNTSTLLTRLENIDKDIMTHLKNKSMEPIDLIPETQNSKIHNGETSSGRAPKTRWRSLALVSLTVLACVVVVWWKRDTVVDKLSVVLPQLLPPS